MASSTRPQTFYNPLPHEEDSRPVIPKWWTGSNAVPESEFVVDCAKLFPGLPSLAELCVDGGLCPEANDGTTRVKKIDRTAPEGAALRAAMKEAYDRVGAVVVRNTGLTQGVDMKAVVHAVTNGSVKYEGGANPRDAVPEASVYDTGAPLDAHLHYHHEMAYVEETVANLGFVCLENTNPAKGHTFLSHNLTATDVLLDPRHPLTSDSKLRLGEKLREKGLSYVRKLPDRKFFQDHPGTTDPSMVYNFWQRSFLTDDADEATHQATTKKKLQVEWEDSALFGRYMVTKHVTDAFEYCTATDRNLLFASIADDYMWFDSWAGVMDLPHHERPLKLNFGDGEVMTREEKQDFVDAYDAGGIRLAWRQGDVAVVCNFRTAHGRPPVADLLPHERRRLGVVLGPLTKKRGVLDGKW